MCVCGGSVWSQISAPYQSRVLLETCARNIRNTLEKMETSAFGILINWSTPSLPPPHFLHKASSENHKGASCVCEFLPCRDSRRSSELWAPRCRMKEIFLKLPAEQLSSPGPVNRIWFMFNFTIFLFLAPDSWTMTRALYCLLQLEDRDCFHIG